MSKKSYKEQLKNALSFLKDGQGITLEEDTFLVSGGLDGSDKCYGFIKEDGKLLCRTRECSDGYPINDMDKDDLNYIFNQSKIFTKIEASGKGYNVVDSDEV